MFPQFYQIHLEKQLKPAEYLTLKILVYLLQSQKQVNIELLVTLMPYPIQFESRRRSLQRFLKLDGLNIEILWFPLLKKILQAKFKKSKPLKLAIDRTQWRSQNVFMRSLDMGEKKYPIILATSRSILRTVFKQREYHRIGRRGG
jgi:hypothetical protein